MYKLKHYLLDQLFYFFFGGCIILGIHFVSYGIVAMLLDVAVVLLWGYHCRALLVFPIDWIRGTRTKNLFFSCQCNIQEAEFFKEEHFAYWKFVSNHGEMLELTVPLMTTKEELALCEYPPKDTPLKVTYFQLSKILCRWEIA